MERGSQRNHNDSSIQYTYVQIHYEIVLFYDLRPDFHLAGMDDEDNDNLPLHEMLDDKLRVRYFKGYLASVAQAIT